MTDEELRAIKERYEECDGETIDCLDAGEFTLQAIRAVMADHAALIAEVERLRASAADGSQSCTAMLMEEQKRLRDLTHRSPS